ncbi:MAG: ROK family protein [Pseudobdellovibrionaceae bacterium]
MKIGIDFGGTKTEIVCLSETGKELYRHRVPTLRDDYKGTIKAFTKLIETAEDTLGKKGSVGIAIPGNISAETGIIKSANTTWIVGKPFRDDLSKALKRDVAIDNDANCFAVSEAADGAGAGKRVVFGGIVGTGFGAGIALNGKSWAGRNEIAGEWGHTPLPFPRVYIEGDAPQSLFDTHKQEADMAARNIFKGKGTPDTYTNDPAWSEYPGPLCYCGKRGCLERWVSGTGLKRDYAYVTGEEIGTHEIIANAQNGEAKAVAAFDRYLDRLARACGMIITILDPDVIVLGGGMSNVDAIYAEVPKRWDRYHYARDLKTKLLPARHGDSSGVRGAAWLGSQQ